MKNSINISVDQLNMDTLISTLLEKIDNLQRSNEFYAGENRRLNAEIARMQENYLQEVDVDG